MTSATKRHSRSALGAPSQHNQSSRKGKKAWRKNVDIGEVEQGLEGLRQEERVTGYTTVFVLHFLIDKNSDIQVVQHNFAKVKG